MVLLHKSLAKDSLDLLQVDSKGLDNIDYKILECLIKRYDGRAVGLETIDNNYRRRKLSQ